MNAKAASSIAPPNSIRIWSDGLWLYAEIPGNPPYIQAESICEAGLWKLINLLRRKAKDIPVGSADLKKTTFVPKTVAKAQGTAEQRDAARDVLKKLGMLP